MPSQPRVFITYRHENDKHRKRVLAFASRLQAEGIAVILDQLANQQLFGGPDEGWPKWSIRQASNPKNRVLIIASAGWFRCYAGKDRHPDKGFGAAAEASVVFQRLYNCKGDNPWIRVLCFRRMAQRRLPLDLQPWSTFDDRAKFADLVRWLKQPPRESRVHRGRPPAPASAMPRDWPAEPLRFPWPMADHDPVCFAVRSLLKRKAPWRFLPLRGSSETGKSHITRQILANGLAMPGLACGRFDFKGTTNVDLELRSLVQTLGVPLPPGKFPLAEKLAQVLDALARRAKPTLLVLDTYEAADRDTQEWVGKHLLPLLVGSPWLRVVIAGQKLPDRDGAPWLEVARLPLELILPKPRHWLAFSQQHKPGLDLGFVRRLYRCCGGKPAILADVLGPDS